MSQHDLEMLRLEENLARGRNQLSISVTELADRLRPANLINDAVDRVAGRAATATSEAIQAAKTNSGKATLLGAGALFAFELGRRSFKGAGQHASGAEEPPAESPLGDGGDEGVSRERRQRVKSPGPVRTLEYWGCGAAAAAVGYVLGKAIPVSTAEKELVGDLPSDLRTFANRFWQEHARGAKLAAADSFGLARLAAAGLGVMAAIASVIAPGVDPMPRNAASQDDGKFGK
jgi:Protein of unknown function (DUF3618)